MKNTILRILGSLLLVSGLITGLDTLMPATAAGVENRGCVTTSGDYTYDCATGVLSRTHQSNPKGQVYAKLFVADTKPQTKVVEVSFPANQDEINLGTATGTVCQWDVVQREGNKDKHLAGHKGQCTPTSETSTSSTTTSSTSPTSTATVPSSTTTSSSTSTAPTSTDTPTSTQTTTSEPRPTLTDGGGNTGPTNNPTPKPTLTDKGGNTPNTPSAPATLSTPSSSSTPTGTTTSSTVAPRGELTDTGTTTPRRAELASTGTNTGTGLWIALGLVIAGLALTIGSLVIRRRRNA